MKLVYWFLLLFTTIVIAWVAWLLSKPKVLPAISAQRMAELDQWMPQESREGNTISTYTQFAPMLEQLTADIADAKHHVHIQFFKFEDDSVGNLLGDALASRVAEGVEARLLYDDLCCSKWKPLYRRLEAQGVQTAGYGRVPWPFFRKRDNYRNHRKIVVIDGRVAYMGGMNIADRYSHGLDWGTWHDIMIRIEGPTVAQLQRSFLIDWQYATDNLPLGPQYFPSVTKVGDMPIDIVCSGPIGEGPAIMQRLIELLDKSRDYVYCESPYFIPPEELMQAFCRAARRGVDIRVLQPLRGDRGETTQHASHALFAEAMEAGVRFGVYQPGFLHTKLTVADDSVAIVASSNIDYRSMLLCQEVAAMVADSGYALQAKRLFAADEEQSRYIAPEEWGNRPRTQKLKEWLASIIASQL
ncbi:MAG: cardiolipin synthase [Bacteroidales bacterium]|nr:cardiolipin synthase [Bacteroidales bacterium]